jgi:hypothetical protein
MHSSSGLVEGNPICGSSESGGEDFPPPPPVTNQMSLRKGRNYDTGVLMSEQRYSSQPATAPRKRRESERSTGRSKSVGLEGTQRSRREQSGHRSTVEREVPSGRVRATDERIQPSMVPLVPTITTRESSESLGSSGQGEKLGLHPTSPETPLAPSFAVLPPMYPVTKIQDHDTSTRCAGTAVPREQPAARLDGDSAATAVRSRAGIDMG